MRLDISKEWENTDIQMEIFSLDSFKTVKRMDLENIGQTQQNHGHMDYGMTTELD